MKKILLLLSLSVFAVSCNDDDLYVTADPARPVVPITVAAQQVEGSLCSYDLSISAAETGATVLYVVLPTSDRVPTSKEIYAGHYLPVTSPVVNIETESVDLAAGETFDINLEDLASGDSYTIYAVSVNADGIRSETVYTAAAVVPDLNASGTAIAAMSAATSFSGVPNLGGDFDAFVPVVTKTSDTEYTFNTFWGTTFVSQATGGNFDNQYTYPGKMTINADNTVKIVGTATQAYDNNGGTGVYNPCNNTIEYTLQETLFTGAPPVTVVLSLN